MRYKICAKWDRGAIRPGAALAGPNKGFEMLIYFSRILILTLLLTAPLSFTGDSCPDFKPTCEIQEIRSKKAAIVVVKRLTSPVGRVGRSASVDRTRTFPVPDSQTPPARISPFPLHERAPPAAAPFLIA